MYSIIFLSNCWNTNLIWKAATDFSSWGMGTNKLLLLKMMKGFFECFNPNQITGGIWTLFSKFHFNENLAALFLEIEEFQTENYIGLNTVRHKGKFLVCLLGCSVYLCNVFIPSFINCWLLLLFSYSPLSSSRPQKVCLCPFLPIHPLKVSTCLYIIQHPAEVSKAVVIVGVQLES